VKALQWTVPSDVVCVFCQHHPPDPAWRPFCSERCKLLDLGRWLDGRYRIPGDPVADDDGTETDTPEPLE